MNEPLFHAPPAARAHPVADNGRTNAAARRRRGRARQRNAAPRRRAILLFCLLLLLFGGAALHIPRTGDDGETGAESAQGEPPVIAAPIIKSAPDTPGGKEIPHQDLLIYERLAAGAEPAREAAPDSAAASETEWRYVVQLAAFSERESAEAAIPQLRERFPALLASLPFHIQRADLGSGGLWHRVRAGAFAQREEALLLCQAFAARGQDCLVTVH